MKKQYQQPQALKINFNYKEQLVASDGLIVPEDTTSTKKGGCETVVNGNGNGNGNKKTNQKKNSLCV